jgi:glyoxylase-like metal-dependent hydrolase (beta-lactamase superfamily II)
MVHLLPIEIPFESSPVNVYLIEDEPLTLLDTGMNLESNRVDLERQLAALGYRLADIERVIVTHHHVDHFGLASIVVERSGAEVCALEGLVPWLEDYPRNRARELAYRKRLMLRHGVPPSAAERALVFETEHEHWDPSTRVTHPVPDGGAIEFAGRTLRAIRRFGHSPFDTLFHDERRGVVFSGDHLISHISSNPLITPLTDELDEARPPALARYRESLRATREMRVHTVLSGHGGPIHDHRGLIDARFAGQARRREKIRAAIVDGAGSAHEVATAVWRGLADEQPYLTLSEVLGYVDMLAGEGLIREEDDGEVVRLLPVREAATA